MKYDLFLFDLDDTLLDFKESERLSFFLTFQDLGIQTGLNELYLNYQTINSALWKQFELGQTSKENLKVERFKNLFESHQIQIDPQLASSRYLTVLAETVVLIDYSVEICKSLSQFGEIGIITNGIHTVQTQRIKKSKLAPFISFVSVSEECGYAKPDVRFFEHSLRKATQFNKNSALVIGDRIEADIQGAKNFGLDSCWYNPKRIEAPAEPIPTYEISHLSELMSHV